MAWLWKLFIVHVVLCFSLCIATDEKGGEQKDKWKKKHITDYNDADLERLYEQWEEADDEKLEEDELPEWKRPQPKIDLSQLNPDDPEGMLKMSKQGRTLMMFASVSGNPTEKETEQITQLWQTSLFNAHYDVQRYVVGSNRVLFVLKDGSQAWSVKDFLVNQDRCELVTIEGKDYPGKASPQFAETEKETRRQNRKKDTSSKKKSKSTTGDRRNEL